MRSTSRPDGLLISDAPGCFWLFGGFFCFVGAAATAAAILSQQGQLPQWQLLLGCVLGLSGVAAGIYLIYQSPASRVVINAPQRTLTVSRRGLLRRQSGTYSLDHIQSAYLVQGKDIDGDPVFTLRIQLTDGREVPLTLLWLHARHQLTEVLDQLSTYLPRGDMRIQD